MERALILAGLDPYVGFLHRDDYNQLSFVFDFIEPYRPWADEVVFKLFSGKKVNQSHTEVLKAGYSLADDGKRLLMQALVDAFEKDKMLFRKRKLTRAHVLLLEAHNVAQQLLGKAKNDKLTIEEL